MHMKAGRALLLVALGLLAIGALRDLARLGDALPWNQLYDFQDFYCAGEALDHGADPYRYEPLHRCEHRINQTEAYRRDPRRVVPAPLPPYDFPLFMLAARLDVPAARAIDTFAIVAAIVASIWGLTLVDIPIDVAALALVLPAGYLLLSAGQVVPFALTALVFCGVALARRRYAAAGILAALTLIEPHLGLPVCVALLLWVNQSRLYVIACGLLLAVVAVLTVGFSGVAEYIGGVLPAQAAAETGYVYQYSLTYLLHSFGSPAPVALILGELSYIASLALGVWLGQRLSAVLGRRELLAYLPAACSIVGGPYVHMVDLPFAIPAALVLATHLRGNLKNIAVPSLCLLAVPWIAVWITKKLFLASLFVVAALLLRLQADAFVSVGTFASIAAVIYLVELVPPAGLAARITQSFSPSDLAEQAWRAYVARLPRTEFTWFIIKLPTWAALIGILAASVGALRGRATRPEP